MRRIGLLAALATVAAAGFAKIHVFPFFAWGSNGPDNEWWSVLYGLAGYERHGTAARATALWIPFDLSH